LYAISRRREPSIAQTRFTYLRDGRAEARTIVGDGRLAVGAEPDGRFGLLVIDAFSSDSIPVHLLTREAVALYLRKVQPAGILALHLSSAYFDLVPVVAEIAASLGRTGLAWIDTDVTPQEAATGKYPSTWAVLAPDASALAPLRAESRRRPLGDLRSHGGNAALLWTDNHSSPLRALGRRRPVRPRPALARSGGATWPGTGARRPRVRRPGMGYHDRRAASPAPKAEGVAIHDSTRLLTARR
jgi:hypothetical protein